jgi:hypothetical protein
MSFARTTASALRAATRGAAPKAARSYSLLSRAAPKATQVARTLGVSTPPPHRTLPHR